LLGLSAEYAKHAAYLDRWLSEARARDDRFAYSNYVLMGLGGYRYLQRDRPEKAWKEMEEALALWPDDHIGLPHFGAFYAVGLIKSYRSWTDAYEHSHGTLDRLLRTPLAYPRFVRASLLVVHALTCLGAAAHHTGEARAGLLAEARLQRSKLRRAHDPSAMVGELIEGLSLLLEQEPAQARDVLQRAIVQLDKLGTKHWGRQARVALAACEGRHALEASLEAEGQWLSSQGFTNIERTLRWFYPMAYAAL
jgi:hypothetical protein